jgi:HEAT repeat protein
MNLCLERGDLEEKSWQLASAAVPLFEHRPAESAKILKPHLAGKDTQKVRFVLQVIDGAGLTGTMFEDLMPLWDREDDSIGSTTQSMFQSVRDPGVIAALLKVASVDGDRGLQALQILAWGGAAGVRDELRRIAADAAEPVNRRAVALGGLSRKPTEQDIAIAVALLGEREDSLYDNALNVLVEARAKVDPAVLKPHLKPGEWREPVVLKLLSAAGDEAAGKTCLSRAKGGNAWDKTEWYAWAGKSRSKAVYEGLEKAFGQETDDSVRMAVLRGMGECGDPAALGLIVKYVTHPEQGSNAVAALAALGRSSPESMDAILDKLADLIGVAQSGLETFHYSFLDHATTQDRVSLVDAYLRLLDRQGSRRRVREIVVGALGDICRPEFGSTEDAVQHWKGWWEAHRAEFEKAAPKAD